MYQGSPELLKRLDGHRVFVGVCGGIAAYKVASVVSGLVQGGAVVQVAMTDAATKFVTPLTFQSLSGPAVFTSGWDSIDQADPQHVRLAGATDIALIAPCTMNMVSRLATGRVDVRRVDRYRALRRELADQREREVQRERRNSRGRPRGGRR